MPNVRGGLVAGLAVGLVVGLIVGLANRTLAAAVALAAAARKAKRPSICVGTMRTRNDRGLLIYTLSPLTSTGGAAGWSSFGGASIVAQEATNDSLYQTLKKHSDHEAFATMNPQRCLEPALKQHREIHSTPPSACTHDPLRTQIRTPTPVPKWGPSSRQESKDALVSHNCWWTLYRPQKELQFAVPKKEPP